MTIFMRKNAAPQTNCPIHGGDMYASSQDPNAPRLILVHNDSETYASSGQYADAGTAGPPPETGPVKVSKPTGPSEAVAPSDMAYKDPNPADSVEDKYQKLLKQYGITN